MKEVTATKSPSLRQTLSMARDLSEKFDRASLIEVKSWSFRLDGMTEESVKPIFRIYVERKISETFDDWILCQNRYFSIMASPESDFPDEVPND